jgi:DNA mismatch repair protein MutS
LAQLAEKLPALRNFNVQVREWQDEIIFLHKIAPGSADKSYGIHVARLAGVPGEVVDRANEVLAELEAHPLNAGEGRGANSEARKARDGRPRTRDRSRRTGDQAQPSLFGDAEPFTDRQGRQGEA